MNQVDRQHLRALVSSGTGDVLDSSVCEAFERYLESLPWLATRIDWEALGDSTSIRLSSVGRDGLLKWVESTTLASHSHVAAFYSGREPGIVCTLEFGLCNTDLLFMSAPGIRYLFGVDRSAAGWVPAFSAFAEYEGPEELTARARAAQR
jgi:hypothetical protein